MAILLDTQKHRKEEGGIEGLIVLTTVLMAV